MSRNGKSLFSKSTKRGCMYSLTKEFIKLLKSNLGTYNSDYEVENSYDREEGIHLAAPYPDYTTEDEKVSLVTVINKALWLRQGFGRVTNSLSTKLTVE